MNRFWHNVIARHAHHVLAVLQATDWDLPTDTDTESCLRALNIWFQLTRIIDGNIAVKSRRADEAIDGATSVEGSFARVIADLDPKTTAGAVAALARYLSVGPTQIAPPTKAKRVTVLKIPHSAYRARVSLETPRRTPRERVDSLAHIESESDLLWKTGRVRLERPSLTEEVEWGLSFFSDATFDAVPHVFERFHAVSQVHFEVALETGPCIRFHSWISGDRDGNLNIFGSAQWSERLQRALGVADLLPLDRTARGPGARGLLDLFALKHDTRPVFFHRRGGSVSRGGRPPSAPARPAWRFGAESLPDLPVIPWVFARSRNSHLISGWYGFGSALQSFSQVRRAAARGLLAERFAQHRLFRLMVDEVERSLLLSAMALAAEHAELVEDPQVRTTILRRITQEHQATVTALLDIPGSAEIGVRFPMLTDRLAQVREQLGVGVIGLQRVQKA